MRNNQVSISRGRFLSSSGSSIHDIYDSKVMEDGSIKLVKVGEENTDEIIESYAASCSLENILARFSSGDTSALNRYSPFYGDVAEVPKTLAGCMQLMIDAEKAFDGLPASVKNQFNNNWREWTASAGSEAWYSAMQPLIEHSRFSPDSSNNSGSSSPSPQPAAEGSADP